MGPKVEGNLSDKPLTVYFIFSELNNNIRPLNQRERATLGGLDNFLSRKILPRANTDANVVIQSHSAGNKKGIVLFLTEWKLSGMPGNELSQHWAVVTHAIITCVQFLLENQNSVCSFISSGQNNKAIIRIIKNKNNNSGIIHVKFVTGFFNLSCSELLFARGR